MQYNYFNDIKEIGAGGYATVYTAKYKGISEKSISVPELVVLKRYQAAKNAKMAPKLFISEVSNLQLQYN